jgi:HSP20 family molecular chaperone IbpA
MSRVYDKSTWRVQGREGGWPGFLGEEMAFNTYFCHEHNLWQPSTDVYEIEDAFVVRMDLAGIDPKALTIVFDEGVLTVRGERPDRSRGARRAVRQLEICYGPFERKIPVSENVDAQRITAGYDRGFLEVVMPKLAQPSHIRIVVHVG